MRGGRIEVRPAAPGDAPELGRVLHEAFSGIAAAHGFPSDFPSREYADGLAATLVAAPPYRGVVAVRDRRPVGTAFVNVADPVRGIGPVAVAPEAQASGAGRALMEAVMELGAGGAGMRLTQDGFNMASLSLYASLGFAVREPLVLMAGRPRSAAPVEGVRRLAPEDADACCALCARVHGFERRAEIEVGLATGLAGAVRERDGRVVAYATTTALWQRGHGVAETTEELISLLTGSAALDGSELALLLPTRNPTLHHWALREGLRAVKPMALMSHGEYSEPRGAFFPSVAY